MFERNTRNIAIAVTLFVLIALYLYIKELEYSFFMLLAAANVILFAFRRDTLDPNDPYQPFIEKPLEQVLFTSSHLQIKDERIELNKVEKVVLELQQGQGILQLPYNNGGKINICFPAKYLFKLKTSFNQHLPDVEYIS